FSLQGLNFSDQNVPSRDCSRFVMVYSCFSPAAPCEPVLKGFLLCKSIKKATPKGGLEIYIYDPWKEIREYALASLMSKNSKCFPVRSCQRSHCAVPPHW